VSKRAWLIVSIVAISWLVAGFISCRDFPKVIGYIDVTAEVSSVSWEYDGTGKLYLDSAILDKRPLDPKSFIWLTSTQSDILVGGVYRMRIRNDSNGWTDVYYLDKYEWVSGGR
jgi:hypothetical protein